MSERTIVVPAGELLPSENMGTQPVILLRRAGPDGIHVAAIDPASLLGHHFAIDSRTAGEKWTRYEGTDWEVNNEVLGTFELVEANEERYIFRNVGFWDDAVEGE